MTKILGIIPAGGKAHRFNGIPKELLPISQTECGLTRCAQAMLKCADEVLVMTCRENFSRQWEVLGENPRARFVVQPFDGVWETIVEAGKTVADWYLFAMPDTVFPTGAFRFDEAGDVWVGLFQTFNPERFGMLRGDAIVDKQPGPPGWAWGAWAWSRNAMEYLCMALRETHNHTEGLNLLLRKFGYSTFPIEYYYDFASFEDYRGYLCSLT